MSPESGWAQDIRRSSERSANLSSDVYGGSPLGEVEDALTESGAVVLESGAEHVSSLVDAARFEGLPESILRDIRDVAERAATYLERPIIADSFEDQDERRAWRTAIKTSYAPEVAEFFESNRLRLNALSPLLYKIPGLRAALAREQRTSETEYLIHILDEFLVLTGPVPSFEMRYRPMALNEKLVFTQSFSDITRLYLAHVTLQETRAEAA
jgi:hypothetical protein